MLPIILVCLPVPTFPCVPLRRIPKSIEIQSINLWTLLQSPMALITCCFETEKLIVHLLCLDSHKEILASCYTGRWWSIPHSIVAILLVITNQLVSRITSVLHSITTFMCGTSDETIFRGRNGSTCRAGVWTYWYLIKKWRYGFQR